MTGKIDKFTAKLLPKERKGLADVFEKIRTGNAPSLDFKKLSGHASLYRVRKGTLRVILRKEGDSYFLVSIERRGDTTYSNL